MKQILRFGKQGNFRILMVSDFHAGKNCSPKLIRGLDALVEETSPDLVLVGGDQCLDVDNTDDAATYMARLMEPVIRRKIPWAAVFGNHDREVGIPVEEEQKAYERIPGCISEAGPEDINGTGNYRLDILHSDSDETAFHIYALDSFSTIGDYIRIFGLDKDTKFILPDSFANKNNQATPMFDQIMWYYTDSLNEEKKAGKKIPAIMYMHVPLMEFCLIERNPEQTDARGSKRELVGCSEMNSGLFLTCLQRGDVKGIFCGHEHLCDFSGKYCGITLAYASALGYNMSAHDDLRGGRVIDVKEDGTFETKHIKLIDLLGKEAMRDPDYFEGGCKYFFRDL